MNKELVVRSVDSRDLESLLVWRLEGFNKHWQLSDHIPNPTEHAAWFKSRLLSKNKSPFLAVEYNGVTTAYIRFDELGSFQFIVSILVSPKYRGRGLSHNFLSLACETVRQQFPLSLFRAIIHNENIPSQKVFAKCGFMFEKTVNSIFSSYTY